MNDKFQLVKKRDLGDIIQDSIKLLSHPHAQPLWQNILMFVLPAYIISGFFLGQFNVDMQEVLPELQSGQISSVEEMMAALTKVFGFHYYMTLLFSIIAGSLLSAFTYNFIAAYHKSAGQVDTESLRSNAFADIFWIVGFQLLSGFIIGIGIIFFILPGIYLAVVLSVLIAVAKIEDTTFGYAFGRCRELMAGNWWSSLLVIVVVSVLASIASSISGSIFQAIFLMIDKTRGMVLATVLQNTLAGAVGVFTTVAIALQYFNLSDHQDNAVTSLYDDIEDIGK